MIKLSEDEKNLLEQFETALKTNNVSYAKYLWDDPFNKHLESVFHTTAMNCLTDICKHKPQKRKAKAKANPFPLIDLCLKHINVIKTQKQCIFFFWFLFLFSFFVAQTKKYIHTRTKKKK